MTPNAAAVEGVERKKRALRHYSAEAATALRIEQLEAQVGELREALGSLLPGLELDLRYADADDDLDALRSRIRTVRDALAKAGASHV